MPSYVVKPDPNVDAYVIWSTVVDCPVSTLGTRAETEAYLKQIGQWVAGRIDRADATGTSCLLGWYGWNDETFLVRECIPRVGVLKRSDLLAFCRAYADEDEAEMVRLTTECEEADDA